MKMRFSTACDYNYHQREPATERERAATCALPRAHPRGLHSCVCIRYSCRALPLRARLSTFCPRTFMWPPRARPRVRAQHACVCVRSLNLLHLCSAECIYMKRRLTFLFRLKPRRPDILLTVAGDILPLLPREDYITPLLSPLISLSNILLIPPLLCPIPFRSSLGYPHSLWPDCSLQSATLKRKRALREERKPTLHSSVS